MAGCGNCGKAVPVVGNQVGRRDTCPHCDAELHSCQSCRHADESVAKGCKEPFAEVPDDRHGGNFCEFFQIGDGVNRGGPDRATLLSAAEALFRK